MNLLILAITAVVPFFSATLIFGLPNIHDTLLIHIEKYFYFMMVPILWQLTLRSAELFLSARPEKNTPVMVLSTVLLTLLTICSLFGLQMIKIRFVTQFFYLIIASISLASASVALHKRGRPYAAIAMLSLDALVLANCSFLLVGAGSWQGFLFSSGLVLQLAAYRLSLLMIDLPYRLFSFKSEPPLKKRPPAILNRVYPLALISGVIITTLMSMIGQLHVVYLALYLILPLIIKLAEEFRKNQGDPRSIPDFASKNCGILLFIIAMIPALTLLIQN